MVRCSGSLWSADLMNLGAEIERVEPFVERFHLDVADGVYVPTFLFFPDLVRAIRGRTSRPLEVHLMVRRPEDWIGEFAEAGATDLVVCWDTIRDFGEVRRMTRGRRMRLGVSLRIGEGLELLEEVWDQIDQVTVFGTEVGIKGVEMDPGTPEKVRRAREIVKNRGVKVEVEVDGGIRRHTVPMLAEAGADWIVPGSLLFQDDPGEMRRWLDGLPTP